MWSFRLGSIEGARRIRAADGKLRQKGYLLVPKGKIRESLPSDAFWTLSGSQWVGAIRYFEEATGHMLRVEDAKRRVQLAPPASRRAFSPSLHPLFTDNTGSRLNAPERELVSDYVLWINDYNAFGPKAVITSGEVDLYI